MKKLYIFMWCLFGFTMSAISQDNTVKLVKLDTIRPYPPYYNDQALSHWSFQIKGGGNYFNIPPDAVDEMDRLNIGLGGDIEYSINPVAGLFVEYVFNDFSRPYTYLGNIGNFKSESHEVLLGASFNLSNVFNPKRLEKRYINLYGNVGGGVSFFKSVENWQVVSKGSPALMAKLGLSLECSLSKRLALALNADYHQYDAIQMNSGIANRNSDALMLTLGFRAKLGSKDNKHVRNILLKDMSKKPKPIVITKTFRNRDTEPTIKTLQTLKAEQDSLKQQLKMKQEQFDQATKK